MAELKFPDAMLPARAPGDASARLLLLVVRRMAAGGLRDAHAAHALIGAFGRSYRRPLVLMRAMMAELARAAAAPILVAPCCCPRMTAPERLILAGVADARFDPRLALPAFAELLGRPQPVGAVTSAAAVAAAFADLGRPIRLGDEC